MGSLGERLRRLRLERNLSLYDVERLSGYHFTTIGKYERGERRPSLEVLRELARLYQVPLSELLDEEEREKEEPARKRIQEAVELLTEEEAELLAAFLLCLLSGRRSRAGMESRETPGT